MWCVARVGIRWTKLHQTAKASWIVSLLALPLLKRDLLLCGSPRSWLGANAFNLIFSNPRPPLFPPIAHQKRLTDSLQSHSQSSYSVTASCSFTPRPNHRLECYFRCAIHNSMSNVVPLHKANQRITPITGYSATAP